MQSGTDANREKKKKKTKIDRKLKKAEKCK